MKSIDKQLKDLGEPHASNVYHYTKLSNLFGIITADGIIFHAGRYDSMNDPEDSVYQTNRINYLRFESGSFEILGDFGTGEAIPFLVSFSCSEDNPLMWRLYDADVCLHIDSTLIYEYCKSKSCKHTIMGKVDYSGVVNSSSKAGIKMHESTMQPKYIEQREYEAEVYLSFYKHPDFAVEDEWRLASFGKDEICSQIKAKGFKYNSVSFYREIYLPKECLKGITIRTYNSETYNTLAKQIQIMLKRYEYANTIIVEKTKTAEVR